MAIPQCMRVEAGAQFELEAASRLGARATRGSLQAGSLSTPYLQSFYQAVVLSEALPGHSMCKAVQIQKLGEIQ